jgi:hypothetical protein
VDASQDYSPERLVDRQPTEVSPTQGADPARALAFLERSPLTPVPWWRVTGSSAYLHVSVQPGGRDLNRGQFLAGATPRHQLGVERGIYVRAAWGSDVTWRLDRSSESTLIDAYY